MYKIGQLSLGRGFADMTHTGILAVGQTALKTSWTGLQKAVDDFTLAFFERSLRVALPKAGFEHDISQQIVGILNCL